MYTHIICPVDFSEASINAVEYAAKIAQQFSGRLFLLNVKPLLATELIGGNADTLRKAVIDTKTQMDDICRETGKMIHASCTSEVIVAFQRLEKIISNEVTEKSMIIMGTNGIDDLYQYFFGTHTFNVIKTAHCPVFLIPEEISYSTIKELVYTWDYKKPRTYLEQTIQFSKQFSVKIHLLHISKSRTIISEDTYTIAANEIGKFLEDKNIHHSFEKIYSDDIADGINQYMIKKENSILVISVRHQNIIERIFKKNNIKKLSAIASYPVLFIHEKERKNGD